MENNPYKVVKIGEGEYAYTGPGCESPYHSEDTFYNRDGAQKRCNDLNAAYNAGLAQNPDQKVLAEMKSDIDHAYAEAKTYCPDFPWSTEPQTASMAVYVCGGAYKGVDRACTDWINLFKALAPAQYDLLTQMPINDPVSYENLMKAIQSKL